MEIRDPQQVEQALSRPERLLLHPHPRHLAADCDGLTLAHDRGRVCVLEDFELKATRAIAADTSRAIRSLPQDHVEYAAKTRAAMYEEQVFKDLRVIREMRRPLYEAKGDQRGRLEGSWSAR